jgi:hypothetical protein
MDLIYSPYCRDPARLEPLGSGGRASNVLRPVTNIASGLVSFAVRLCMSALGGVVRLLGGTLKLPSSSPKYPDDKAPPGRTPPSKKPQNYADFLTV